MPRSVSAIRSSSSCAGTTTATRLPSTMRLSLPGRGPIPARDDGLGSQRRDGAEEQADPPPDERRRACAPRGRLRRDGRLDDAALLDLRREREELAGGQQVLLERAAPLLERRERGVEAGHEEQPLGQRQRLVLE